MTPPFDFEKAARLVDFASSRTGRDFSLHTLSRKCFWHYKDHPLYTCRIVERLTISEYAFFDGGGDTSLSAFRSAYRKARRSKRSRVSRPVAVASDDNLLEIFGS